MSVFPYQDVDVVAHSGHAVEQDLGLKTELKTPTGRNWPQLAKHTFAMWFFALLSKCADCNWQSIVSLHECISLSGCGGGGF